MVKGFKITQFIQAARKKMLYEIVDDSLALANEMATMAVIIPYSEGIMKTIKSKTVMFDLKPGLYVAITREAKKVYVNNRRSDNAEIMNDTEIILTIGKSQCRVYIGKQKVVIVPNGAVKAFEQYYVVASELSKNSPLVFYDDYYCGLVFPRLIDFNTNKEVIKNVSRLSNYLAG